jgi:glycosyltransferase involved in cell wall biosynthesis
MTPLPPARLDQFMAGFAVGDATSQSALLIRDRLRAMGLVSDLYVDPARLMDAGRAECRPLTEYVGGPLDGVLHHFGLWSEVTDAFCAVSGPRILYYHNITPGSFFRGYDDTVADRLDGSRARLPELLPRCTALWAVSDFNAQELRALSGGRTVEVLPLPFDPAVAAVAPDPALLRRLRAPVTTILSVGRLAPNKRLEELIRAFAVYHRRHNPCSRLLLVGSDRSAPRYVTYLKWLAHERQVPNVCFEGFVWPDALAAYYRLADVYVAVSDHEGYCLPLLEAMAHGVPVIAKRTGGMPEALGGAGRLYDSASDEALAAVLHALVADGETRAELLAGQARRLQVEQRRDLGATLRSLLGKVESGA